DQRRLRRRGGRAGAPAGRRPPPRLAHVLLSEGRARAGGRRPRPLTVRRDALADRGREAVLRRVRARLHRPLRDGEALHAYPGRPPSAPGEPPEPIYGPLHSRRMPDYFRLDGRLTQLLPFFGGG